MARFSLFFLAFALVGCRSSPSQRSDALEAQVQRELAALALPALPGPSLPPLGGRTRVRVVGAGLAVDDAALLRTWSPQTLARAAARAGLAEPDAWPLQRTVALPRVDSAAPPPVGGDRFVLPELVEVLRLARALELASAAQNAPAPPAVLAVYLEGRTSADTALRVLRSAAQAGYERFELAARAGGRVGAVRYAMFTARAPAERPRGTPPLPLLEWSPGPRESENLAYLTLELWADGAMLRASGGFLQPGCRSVGRQALVASLDALDAVSACLAAVRSNQEWSSALSEGGSVVVQPRSPGLTYGVLLGAAFATLGSPGAPPREVFFDFAVPTARIHEERPWRQEPSRAQAVRVPLEEALRAAEQALQQLGDAGPAQRARAPEVSLAELETEGGDGELDEARARALVRAELPTLRACYLASLVTAPYSGHLTAHVGLTARGSLQGEARLESPASTALTACVRQTLARVRFPAPRGGTVELAVGFRFADR